MRLNAIITRKKEASTLAQDKYDMNSKIFSGMLEKSYEVLHEFDRSTESAVNVNT